MEKNKKKKYVVMRKMRRQGVWEARKRKEARKWRQSKAGEGIYAL